MIHNQKIEIRNAEIIHLPSIKEIEDKVFVHPWSSNALSDELLRDDSVFLVALSDTNVCGYLNCRKICGEGYIGNLAVDPSFRRVGIGRRLMESLIAQAAESDLEFLTLEVRTSNIPAIRLYETLGFQKVGERKAFYSDPTENAALYTLYLKEEGNNTDENISN